MILQVWSPSGIVKDKLEPSCLRIMLTDVISAELLLTDLAFVGQPPAERACRQIIVDFMVMEPS